MNNNENNINKDPLIRKTFANCLILEKIGQGGMGVVYKGHHIKLNKTVCVKILAKELEADKRNIDFFLREAEISKQLDHPNTVHIYDYGKEKDNYYIVMSYVDGKSLEQIVKEKGHLDVKEACDIMLGVFKGLEHAHSKNIIHRDIKPSNILITKEDIPRIIDFGLARRIKEEKQLTIAGEMIGTAYFMSPEQGLSKPVDHRADLYSAGATLFYILTGKYPFEGQTAIEVINKHIKEPLPNLYLLKPDLPLWLVKMIEKLMAKNPENRYQSATEIIKELEKHREKNYEDSDMVSEIEYDINDITDPKIEVKDAVKKKEVEFDLGIENKTLKTNETNKEFYENKHEKIKEIEKDIEEKKEAEKKEKEEIDRKKLTSETAYSITKISFHIFFSFILFLSMLSFSMINNSDNLLGLIKNITKNPGSAILIILSVTSIYLMMKQKKIKQKISYFSMLAILLFSLLKSGIKISFVNSPFIDKLIYLMKKAYISHENLWIFAFFIAYAAYLFNKEEKNKIKRSIASLITIVSLLFFYNSFLTALDIEITFNFKFFTFIFIFSALLIYSVFSKKNLLLIYFILFSFITLYGAKNDYVEKFSQIKYKEKLETFEEEKHKIELKVREDFYNNIDNYSLDERASIEDKIEEKIKEELSKIPKPTIESARKELTKEYYQTTFSRINSILSRNIFLIAILSFLLINFIFLKDLGLKDDFQI